ncbi:ATP-binding protein [Geothrix sp. PMB-07]|uniref:ATP-binding protein n=1 Tax=Geothrix sp. PMB-07 TaxID=3068640 RepID=UPI0027417B0B|nr:ATP-binding protein [Geothrix sp. PMB-07]WLT31720.1 response regulator [Geothrix sp. PMB-07]
MEEAPRKSVAPSFGSLRGWSGVLLVPITSLLYFGAAHLPHGLAFQAYFFWSAAAVAYTVAPVWGPRAFWGLALGSLLLNLGGWLPWPYALLMTLLQTSGPWLAWWAMGKWDCPRPNLGHTRDLLLWLGLAAFCSALFSSGLGSLVIALANPGGSFTHTITTAFSWFLGDFTAIVCLGPFLLNFLPRNHPHPLLSNPVPTPAFPLMAKLLLGAFCLVLLLAGRIHEGLSEDFRLALQFALVLPGLWVALRYGPRASSVGLALLSVALLSQLWLLGPGLPDEVFRFSQCLILVLGLATHVTAAAAEETRQAQWALHTRDLQTMRMEAVGTLAGGLVHEFNNQLTVVLGNLDRLKASPMVVPQTTGLLGRIEEAALSITRRVQQLKFLSHHAPMGAIPLRLGEALGPFLAATRALPQRIAFEWSHAEDPIVDVDPDLLNQALQHLLNNAVEAIPEQGRITLQTWQEDGWARISLVDSGSGMTPEVLLKACDPFFTTKPVAPGRGLGLSIAFSLIRQMGGSLNLSSQPELGTQADLSIPLSQSTPLPASPTPQSRPTHSILLADDEVGIRELTREFLESEGFAVVDAGDGHLALELFLSDPKAWDLVILDLVMPRLGGAEVLARIEALRPDLPALMISGYSTDARADLLSGPHRAFLSKPFRLQQLKEAMTTLGLHPPQGPK